VPRNPVAHKIKKSETALAIDLDRAPDILAHCGKMKRPHQVLVGFALETHQDEAEARRKLAGKNLDLIVLNNSSTPGAGFEVDTNVVTLITSESSQALPLLPKPEVAKEIVAKSLELLSRVSKSNE
jgi:phosphopantothenoylcysteine decarboxylase/phosphopantothenate--cysteine ligase